MDPTRIASVLLCATLAGGCGPARPARVVAPALDPGAVTSAVFRQADGNGDGTLSAAEVAKVPAVAMALTALDANGDGGLSAAELSAWLQAVRDSKVAITSLSAQVSHKGKPLANALVKLVPEPAMGGAMQAAEGRTDATGNALLTIPGGQYPGVNCGLYRVEITGSGNDGKPLPASANTASTLGVAVGGIVPENGLVTFDLD